MQSVESVKRKTKRIKVIDVNKRTDAWVGAASSSVIATLRHIVGSGVNIFHRLVHVPHGSWIFSRVEPVLTPGGAVEVL